MNLYNGFCCGRTQSNVAGCAVCGRSFGPAPAVPAECCTECGLPLKAPCSKCAARRAKAPFTGSPQPLSLMPRPIDQRKAYADLCAVLGWTYADAMATPAGIERAAAEIWRLAKLNPSFDPGRRRER